MALIHTEGRNFDMALGQRSIPRLRCVSRKGYSATKGGYTAWVQVLEPQPTPPTLTEILSGLQAVVDRYAAMFEEHSREQSEIE